MNQTTLQTIIWVAAAILLLLYLARRRKNRLLK